METQNTPNNQGWVKLHRKSLNSRALQNPRLWQLWTYCLLRANHKAKWVSVTTGRGETEVYVKPGQFIFGRFKAAEALKAKPDATYKRLCKLKNLENITTQNKTHYTLVTVSNWDFYQGDQANDTTQVTPKYHPSNTNKNDKNVKKYSPTPNGARLSRLLLSEIRKRKSNFREPNLQEWAKHIDRLIRIDRRTPEQIEAVIRWCQQNDFWQNNILSTEKLRKQIDKLELQMQQEWENKPRLAPLQRTADGRTPREVALAQVENERT